MRTNKFESLRRLAEQSLQQKGQHGTQKNNLPTNLNELVHELEVHQVELEMQHKELRQAYESLVETKKHYTDLFDFAPVGYLVTDAESRIESVNLTLSAMLGIERDGLYDNLFSTWVVESYQDSYYLHRRAALQTKETQTMNVQVRRQDGSTFFAHLTSEIVYGQSRTLRTSVADVTRIKDAEAAMRRSLERERELVALKSRLIEMISHELRTPLSTILSSVDILDGYSDKLTDEEKAKRYQSIRNYVWYLNDIVNDVLVAHRSGEESYNLSPEKIELVACLQTMVDDIHNMVQDQQINLVIGDTLTDDTVVNWDRHLTRRIVANLLSNALKYSDEDVLCRVEGSKRTISIIITDQGRGIPADDQLRIFDMFYRGGNTVSVPGTGVGLSIVKSTVDVLQGTVFFESSSDGTTFTVRLPRDISA